MVISVILLCGGRDHRSSVSGRCRTRSVSLSATATAIRASGRLVPLGRVCLRRAPVTSVWFRRLSRSQSMISSAARRELLSGLTGDTVLPVAFLGEVRCWTFGMGILL